MIKLVFPLRLGTLNEYIEACRRNPHVGNQMKRKDEETLITLIKSQTSEHFNRVRIDYLWVEPNTRRDKDNISSYGRKVIQDALVIADVLDNDGWKQIDGFSDTFAVDKDNPRIEVTIREVDECAAGT